MSYILRFFLLTLISVLLYACSVQQRPPGVDLAMMQRNTELQHWQLQGKLGIRDAQRADSAFVNWQQNDDQSFAIRLSGPLGQSLAKLTGSPGAVRLQTKQETVTAATPEQLLLQELGWQLPISQLVYWVRGVPDPASPYQIISGQDSFTQSGWSVDYSITRQVDGYTLPIKITLYHPDLLVTWWIEYWRLAPL